MWYAITAVVSFGLGLLACSLYARKAKELGFELLKRAEGDSQAAWRHVSLFTKRG